MENQKNEETPKEPVKDMKTRQREFMDSLFGKPTSFNIWGRKFTIFAAIFLSLMTAFVIWGVATGNIDVAEQMEWNKKHPHQVPKDSAR